MSLRAHVAFMQRLETIVAAYVGPDHVPNWQGMADDLRDEPLYPDPEPGPHGLDTLPWCTWWEAVTFRRCPARREDHARCDLRAGHRPDHAAERGMGADLRWSTRLTTPPLTPRHRPVTGETDDERLDEMEN